MTDLEDYGLILAAAKAAVESLSAAGVWSNDEMEFLRAFN
jgi:hypothetical protein